MAASTLPVLTLIALKLTVTISLLYCVLGPIPRNLYAAPPDSLPESYPIIPPSMIMPANCIGINGLASLPSYASRICRIINRSLVSASILVRSTTSNH